MAWLDRGEEGGGRKPSLVDIDRVGHSVGPPPWKVGLGDKGWNCGPWGGDDGVEECVGIMEMVSDCLLLLVVD